MYKYFIQGFSKIAKLLTSIIKTTLTKSAKYSIMLGNIFQKNSIDTNKYKDVRKSRNKIVKILANSKNRNLSKSK